MHIIKRDGSKEAMKFDKIGTRIRQQCNGLDRSAINPVTIAQMIISSLRDGITSHEIDTLISETCHSLVTRHPDFDVLALRIAISRLHKEAPMTFLEAMQALYQNTDASRNPAPLISDKVLELAGKYESEIESHIQDDRDYRYTYFGFKTLEKSYLQRSNKKIVETPQYMLMRVALGIHEGDLESAFKTYDDMSQGYYTHATPTLFNSGTRRPQNSSCFLLTMEDSLEGIFKVLSDCAMISKNAGGIGLSASKIRATDSYIRGTGGKGNGLVPMLQVFNATSRYVDQGGKRKGSIAVYLEPWHADVEAFIDLKRPHGAEEDRARDLFPALWIPDLFMQRAKEDKMWSLFCPDECPGLTEVFDEAPGGEFTQLYERYEREGRARKQFPARELIVRICTAQIESGTPYVLYKDAVNRKSNQKNIGIIRQSNLCCMTGDQRAVTDRGLLTVRELYELGGKNKVVGRSGVVEASEMLLPRPNAPIVKIVTKEGYEHKVTPDHKVWVKDRGWVEAQELKAGDKLEIQQVPGLWGTYHNPELAFIAGMVAGDGTFSYNSARISLWEGKTSQYKELLETYTEKAINEIAEKKGRLKSCAHAPKFCQTSDVRLDLHSVLLYQALSDFGLTAETKHSIPESVWRGDEETVCAYLRGLFLCDGTVTNGSEITTMSLCSISLNLLKEIQILLANFGVKSTVTTLHDGGYTNLPDGNGGYAKYYQKPCWRILITSIRGNAIMERITGLGQNRGNLVFLENIKKEGYVQKMFATFSHLESLPNEDAYCLQVFTDEHSWTVNGLITKNTEITEVTTPEEHAVCNLASISLPAYFNSKTGVYDFDTLGKKVRHIVKSLNRVIDVNLYPVKETQTSNMRHRPIGIGYQGLADLFALAKTPFDSPLARQLNRDIAEAVYYHAVAASADLAESEGAYETFPGSPMSQGLFQFDLWDIEPSSRYDWEALRERVKRVGVRNSLLVAPMPTASTSQILGNNECFEPFTSTMYSRRVGAGEYIVLNKHLVRDLRELGLWGEAMSRKIMSEKGSVQNILEIPEHVRAIYRTVWEISQKSIIEMAADRGAFVCQSQSMNLFVPNPNTAKITSMMFYAWEHGLKTGSYYIRVPNARDAVSFTVVPVKSSSAVESLATVEAVAESESSDGVACSLDNPEACEMCSG